MKPPDPSHLQRSVKLLLSMTEFYIYIFYIYSGKAHGIHYDVALLKYHIT